MIDLTLLAWQPSVRYDNCQYARCCHRHLYKRGDKYSFFDNKSSPPLVWKDEFVMQCIISELEKEEHATG